MWGSGSSLIAVGRCTVQGPQQRVVRPRRSPKVRRRAGWRPSGTAASASRRSRLARWSRWRFRSSWGHPNRWQMLQREEWACLQDRRNLGFATQEKNVFKIITHTHTHKRQWIWNLWVLRILGGCSRIVEAIFFPNPEFVRPFFCWKCTEIHPSCHRKDASLRRGTQTVLQFHFLIFFLHSCSNTKKCAIVLNIRLNKSTYSSNCHHLFIQLDLKWGSMEGTPEEGGETCKMCFYWSALLFAFSEVHC